MSRSLNKVMLIGNVGNDPEIRATSSGSRVGKVSIATNRSFQDRSGQRQEKTEWHRLTFFGKLTDIVEQWVHKGDRIYVEGRLEYSQTQDDKGNTRYWTDIIVSEMVMLGSMTEGTDDVRAESSRFASGPPAGGAPTGGDPSGGSGGPPLSEPDDDLPF